jgi:hypothetical protein
VPEPCSEHVQTTKLLMVVANVLLHDLAGVAGREREFHAAIDRLMAVDRPGDRADLDAPSCDLLLALWTEVEDRARQLPGWERHRLLWRFDCGQVLAAMRYVVLTRTHPGLDNLAENGAYLPRSKDIMAFATLDLMTAPHADEIGLVREVAWHAQAVAQVANIVVSWRREVADRDFSSRVFALALDRGVLTRAELETLAAGDIVERIERAGVEQTLLDELRSHRSRVAEVAARSSAIDLGAYERALEEVLAMELAARGQL